MKDQYKKNKRISIVGLGWLGYPLAQQLCINGYTLVGSYKDNNPVQNEDTINAYYLNIAETIECDNIANLFDVDVLVVNIPPKRRDDIEKFHPKQIEALLSVLPNNRNQKVIFVSSTSVYPDLNGVVTEDNAVDPVKSSGKALLKVEVMLQDHFKEDLTIIRFGGLIGYDRMPGRFLSGKKIQKNGNTPVNLIHRDDCIEIISRIIVHEKWGKVYSACMPEHPTREQFYTEAALKQKFPVPVFDDNKGDSSFKIVTPERLIQDLPYTFKYNNPLDVL